MGAHPWLSQLSSRQRMWMAAAMAGMVAIIGLGLLWDQAEMSKGPIEIDIGMSIREIAPQLGVTGKALARELNLPIDVPKRAPLDSLGVKESELLDAVRHLLSHRESTITYYVYLALVLWGCVFLVRIGRPDGSDVRERSVWYPRDFYMLFLLLSVTVAGFITGKSPNPMESIVKVCKSLVGLYPDPAAKVTALGFFILLAVIGNKVICGWACPFGALQELIYNLPVLRTIKKKKLPFRYTNAIRTSLFIAMLLVLFGAVGGRQGTVVYHAINPFNLFDLDVQLLSVWLTIFVSMIGAFMVYRPFCQLLCPFGLVSWLAERLSLFRVRIDRESCTRCGACIRSCPLEAAQGRVAGKIFPADCFSCARCLNACPVDAIRYTSVLKKAPFFDVVGPEPRNVRPS